jgi:RHS repeat-associated protein
MGTTTLTYQGATQRVLSAIPTIGPKTLFTYGTAAEDFRLKQISNQSLTNTVISDHRYTYSKDGQIATWQRSYDAASGTPTVTDRFDYDLADRLISSVVKNTASGAVLKESQFIQDPADNLTSIREGDRLRSATYNLVNQQLTESAGGKVRITGTINKPGATVTLAGAPAAVHPQGGFAAEVTAAQGANHFPLVVTEANGTVTTKYVDLQVENGVPMVYAYDLNGNLTSIAPQATPAVPTRTYQWDAADRLIGITRILSPTETRKTELQYNGMGSRVGKTELLNGAVQTSIKYQYGDTGVLQERSADGGTVLKTYTSQGEQFYSFVNNQTSIINRYYTRDHLGSVREVVTSTGAVFVRYDYTPYGERSRVAGSFATFEAEKGYTGHDYHVDSGLILTRFRAYDPRTARWLSRDPIQETGGMNLYGYVGGDPVNGVDRLGLDVCYLVDDGNKAAAWQSHAATLIGNDTTGWAFMSFSPGGLDLILYPSFADAQAAQTDKYDRYLRFPSTPDQDRDARHSFYKGIQKSGPFSGYKPFSNNCGHVAANAVKVAFPSFEVGTWRPKMNYENNIKIAPISGNF